MDDTVMVIFAKQMSPFKVELPPKLIWFDDPVLPILNYLWEIERGKLNNIRYNRDLSQPAVN